MTESTALILSLLTSGDKYGNELVRESEGALKPNAIHTQLQRLESKGFVESNLVAAPPGERGPGRRVYRLTALGELSLQHHEANTLGDAQWAT